MGGIVKKLSVLLVAAVAGRIRVGKPSVKAVGCALVHNDFELTPDGVAAVTPAIAERMSLITEAFRFTPVTSMCEIKSDWKSLNNE